MVRHTPVLSEAMASSSSLLSSCVGGDALPPSHSVLMYVLSVDSPSHAAFRCYQRAALSSFGLREGQWKLHALSSSHTFLLKLFYVIDK
eukprot:scaffold102651_cov31-Tisochrysis_lutea.AAC.1